MKLLKKIISATCSIAILGTMTSSMLVANAEGDKPTISIEVADSEYDAETGKGTLRVYLENVPLPRAEAIQEYTMLDSWTSSILINSSDFDTSLYSNGMKMAANMGKSSHFNGTQAGAIDTTKNTLTATWATAAIDRLFEDHPSVGSRFGEKTELYSLKFTKLKPNGSAKMSFAKGQCSVLEFNDEGAEASSKAFDTSAGTMDVKVVMPEGSGITVEIPANTGSSADSNAIKAFNPADLGLTPASDGYFAPSADYANANDRAIAVANNFGAPGAFNKIKWTMSRTPVGGVAETASLTKSIANIDTNAAITVGMVVGFDITEYSAVSITNVELINE